MMQYGYEHAAHADFEKARRGAFLSGLFATMAGRPNDLLRYDEARRALGPVGESYRGLQVIPIERIVGTTDRLNDFDRGFRPRRSSVAGRWQRVALAHYEDRPLPPVQLYQVGGDFFVEDGHHRISVARLRGQEFIEAEVTEVRSTAPGSAAASRENHRERRTWRPAAALRATPAHLGSAAQECPA